MDKHILHSVLETVSVGSPITLNFVAPFENLSGDYTVLVSKVGRGRGGSRVISVASATNPSDKIDALDVKGTPKLLGTGVSEYISTVVYGGKTYGMEDPIETARNRPAIRRGNDGKIVSPDATAASTMPETAPVPHTKRDRAQRAQKSSNTSQAHRVAQALGNILTETPTTNFRLVAKQKSSPINGEWSVSEFNYADNILRMSLVSLSNPETTFAFDSSVHGVEVKDAQVIDITE